MLCTTLATKHPWLDLCQYTKGGRFSVLLTVRIPADGGRRRTLEKLEIIGYHTLCGQARKQRSSDALPLSQCAREMLGRLTSDAVFGSNQVRAIRVPVIPHVRQRGTRSRKGERDNFHHMLSRDTKSSDTASRCTWQAPFRTLSRP